MMEIFFFQPAGSMPATLLALVFGLMVGSFLNVLIHRLPAMINRDTENFIAEYQGNPRPHQDYYSIFLPGSACPHCKHKITPLENIPILSYLILRGKCSACKTPISIRYPLVELLTGLVSAGIVWYLGSGVYAMGALLFAYLAISMTAIDMDSHYLPDDLTYTLLWLGLLFNLGHTYAKLPDAIIGAVAGYLFFWTVATIFFLVRKIDGLGGGDFKMLAALGAWFGWQALIPIVLIASVVGLLFQGYAILFRGNSKDQHFAYGPYLALAGVIELLFRYQIAQLLGQPVS